MRRFLSILLIVFLAGASAPASGLEAVLSAQNAEAFELGKKHYQKYCVACHAPSNIMVASPKFADRRDWGARLDLAKNLKGLVKVAKTGKGAMPAKGLCNECKDEDLQAAIVYMMRGLQ